MTGPIRVALLGKGDLAIRVAEWLLASDAHALEAVVPVVPEPAWTGSLRTWANGAGVPVVESGDFRDLEQVEPGRCDLVLSVFYDRILSADFIAGHERVLNVHNAPLPRYRGVSPINWALKNGEQMHGVTIHEITPGIDDGPIVAQVQFSIDPEVDEVRDVYDRCLAFGWTLVEQTLPRLDRIRPVAQDESLATYYGRGQDELLGDRRSFTRGD